MLVYVKNDLKELTERIVESLDIDTRSMRVLDIGCADIRAYSIFLMSAFGKYEGIDINRKFLSIARDRISDYATATVILGNVEDLPYANTSFDFIVCHNSLAYTKKKKAVQEIVRVLKKGGYCLSLYNNCLSYSFRKMIIRETKPLPYEILHSVIVILNTLVLRYSGIPFFHTTYNTFKEARTLLNSDGIDVKFVRKDRIRADIWKIAVINFLFQKRY